MPDSRPFARVAPLPLRLIIGYGFFAHGLAKLERGPNHFVSIVHAIGVPFPYMMARLTILIEVVCGLLMLAGAFVPLITLPMLAVLIVAMATVHIQFGFTSIKLLDVTPSGPRFGPPGIETDLLYIGGLATLVLGGPGPLAIDNWLWRTIGLRSSSTDS